MISVKIINHSILKSTNKSHLTKCDLLTTFTLQKKKCNFFHFGGNSLRRVHVFLPHLEKTYHLFFEPEMGVLTLFSKKGQKGQKKF